MLSSCHGSTNHAVLYLNVNASSPTLDISWFQASLCATCTPPTGATATEQFYVNGATLGSPVDISSLSSTWTSASISTSVVPGSIYTIAFVVTAGSNVTSYSFDYGIDTVSVTGGNIVTTNPNFIMYDAVSGQLFNIAAYPNSYVEVQYPSTVIACPGDLAWTNPLFFNNTVTPQLVLPCLTQATLVTVWIGTSYYRTLIPSTNPASVLKMYLQSPSVVTNYNVQIEDVQSELISSPTNVCLLTQTQFTLSEGSRNISAGYVDAASAYPTWITPGYYSVFIYNTCSGNNEMTSLNLGQTNASPIITINAVKIKLYPSPYSSITAYGAAFTPHGINMTIQYSDVLKETTQIYVGFKYINPAVQGSPFICTDNSLLSLTCLNNTNTSGITSGFAFGPITPVSDSTLNVVIYCDSGDGCNSTMASNLVVYFKVVNTEFGTFSLGPNPVGTGSLNTPNIPTAIPSIPSVGGIDILLPGVSMVSVGAFFIIIIAAGTVGAQDAPIGAIILAVMLDAFAFVGMLPNTPAYSGVYVTITGVSVLAFILQRERRSKFPIFIPFLFSVHQTGLYSLVFMMLFLVLGTRTSWNKGQTKETDSRVAAYSEKVSIAKKGQPSPHKGKTKETSLRVQLNFIYHTMVRKVLLVLLVFHLEIGING